VVTGITVVWSEEPRSELHGHLLISESLGERGCKHRKGTQQSILLTYRLKQISERVYKEKSGPSLAKKKVGGVLVFGGSGNIILLAVEEKFDCERLTEGFFFLAALERWRLFRKIPFIF